MTIYVIGDSHCTVFNNDNRFKVIEGCIPNAGGGPTAYNLNNVNSSTKSNRILFDLVNDINKDTDRIILVYGEIDCRFHIYYQHIKRDEYIDNIIKEIINNYGLVLKKLKEIDINFYVLGITPVVRNGYGIELFTKDTGKNKKYFGEDDEHVNIYGIFNALLKNYCEEKGYRFLNIYSKVVNENGYMNKEYALDGVHLNKKALPFIVEMLNDYGESL